MNVQIRKGMLKFIFSSREMKIIYCYEKDNVRERERERERSNKNLGSTFYYNCKDIM